jgi:predicted amidohydrolase
MFQPRSDTLTPNVTTHMKSLHAAMASAAAAGSDLFLCPELYNTGYGLSAPFSGEPRGGASYELASSFARELNISLLFTYVEKTSDGRLWDAAALFNRSGDAVIDYRKVNLAAGEDVVFSAGPSMSPVAVLDGVRVGVMICFDVFLPEPARILALQSVDVILVPTANGYPPSVFNSVAQLIVPARALENNAFLAYANWWQVNSSFPEIFTFYGQSVVADAGGNIIYLGPNNGSALDHVFLNFTGRGEGNTALTRPNGDTIGLCD